jgi:hypothetical protein
MPTISNRRGLNTHEREFCIQIALRRTQAEAYRRAYGIEEGDITAKAASAAAQKLLKDDVIKGYIEELGGSASDMARSSYIDQLLIDGKNPSNLLGAAKQILEDESLQKKASDMDAFWERAAACGAEVVADVGGKEVVIPLRELMPQYKDAVPPPEVLKKTARSLQEWNLKLGEREEELDARDAASPRIS